jgi:hypothetical protein
MGESGAGVGASRTARFGRRMTVPGVAPGFIRGATAESLRGSRRPGNKFSPRPHDSGARTVLRLPATRRARRPMARHGDSERRAHRSGVNETGAAPRILELRSAETWRRDAGDRVARTPAPGSSTVAVRGRRRLLLSAARYQHPTATPAGSGRSRSWRPVIGTTTGSRTPPHVKKHRPWSPPVNVVRDQPGLVPDPPRNANPPSPKRRPGSTSSWPP